MKAAAREKDPFIVIEGIEEITRRDLAKHKVLIVQTTDELNAYREARAHEVQKKKRWRNLIGGGKYNDGALRKSMSDIAVNIRHLTDKCKAAEEKLKHHQHIVDTLTAQLEEQEHLLKLIRLQRGE